MAQKSGEHIRSVSTTDSLYSSSFSPSLLTESGPCLPPFELPGFRAFPSIFPLLHLALSTGPVCVEIPETLFIAETGHDALLFNDEKKALRLFESGEVLEQFFVQCNDRVNAGEEGIPRFIYHSEMTGYKVLFEQEEAGKMWRASRESSKTLQRYIIPLATEPTKLRLIWQRTHGFKRYRIQKKSLAVFKGRSIPRSKSHISFSSPYKYDLSAFRHAGQLKKSSFSPYLPFKSVLYEELSRNRLGRNKSISDIERNESFLVSSRQEGDYKVEEVGDSLPKAERMAFTLKEVVTKVMLTEDEMVETLAYDVILGCNNEFYLLNAKWLQVSQEKLPVSTRSDSPVKPVSPSSTRERSLRSKFSRIILSPHSSSALPKAPFIDLKDIQAQSARNYHTSHHFPTPQETHSDSKPRVTHLSLDHAQTSLDLIQRNAAEYRHMNKEFQHIKLKQYSDKMLEQVITRVYERMRNDPITNDYFQGKSLSEIAMIKQGFFKAFTGVDNCYFKRNVKKKHEGMGISSQVFTRFLQIFMEVMREEGIRSDDIHIVQGHLERFSEEVVEDEDLPSEES